MKWENPQTSSADVDGFTSGALRASISNQCRTRVPFWAYSMKCCDWISKLVATAYQNTSKEQRFLKNPLSLNHASIKPCSANTSSKPSGPTRIRSSGRGKGRVGIWPTSRYFVSPTSLELDGAAESREGSPWRLTAVWFLCSHSFIPCGRERWTEGSPWR